MSLDEAFRSVLLDVVREVVRGELGKRGPAANAKALSRRSAEKAMGIGRSKLQELIARGEIKTVAGDPRLVPMSEVERFCQPRRQKPRRAVRALPAPSGTTDSEATRARLADAIRRGE